MGEVINVDFKSRARLVPNPVFDRFLQLLVKHGIEEPKIELIRRAIHSQEYFDSCDSDVRKIAEVWIHHGHRL